MTHAIGTCLGGIRTLAELRARCRVDFGAPGCWHLLSARGKPMPTGKRHLVWLYGRGGVTSLRAAYSLAFGVESLADDRVIYRHAGCPSYDCVNPAHLRRGTRETASREQAKRGTMRTEAHRAGAAAAGLRRSRVGLEMRQWLAESTQPAVELAPVFGVAVSHITQLRARLRDGSGSCTGGGRG